MFRSRQTRRFAAILALVSLLFMQLAVAAYACPSIDVEQVGAAVDEDMQGCHGLDKVQPNLCQAHDQVGNQSLDKPPFPSIQPFVPAALHLEVPKVAVWQAQTQAAPGDFFLMRATAPPHAIDHCCFRI